MSEPARPLTRDLRPVVVVHDVASWKALGLVSALGAVYLAYSVVSDFDFGELEVAALALLLTVPVLALLGSRELSVYADRLRVVRRGRVLLDRPLSEIARIRSIPFVDICWLQFHGGGRVILFTQTPEWRTLVDECRRFAG